jgi:transposase-like protein
VQKIIQPRRSAEAWREIVLRQERSGVSVQAFCEREGISAASLYGWRSRLGATRETEIAESRPVESAPTAGFIELGALRAAQSRCEIRLDLGGGVVLQLVRS